MHKEIQTLYVLMNGILIGYLNKKTNSELTFQYDATWLNNKNARPISLSMPLINKKFTGDIVYNFFDNLLPDNNKIRARLQKRFKLQSNQPFDLLASIGKDCVGALQISNTKKLNSIKSIDYKYLTNKVISNILKSYQTAPLGMDESYDDFRISVTGAQEKSAFLRYKNKWCLPIGTTPTTHIFKLPIGKIPEQDLDLRDSCENEWLCTQIVKAFGLPIADCEIAIFEDVKVLIVKRFDRKFSDNDSWIIRLPQIDMCQALGFSPDLKYQTDGGPGIKEIMDLLLGSQTPQQDRDNFFRTQIIFWCLAAIDGHAKNFSIHLLPQGKFQLTPLYDVMSAYPLMAKKQLQTKKIKMAMALQGKNKHYHWHNIQARHFIETAKFANYSTKRAEAIFIEVLQSVDVVINKVKKQLPKDFPNYISTSIFNGMHEFKNKFQGFCG